MAFSTTTSDFISGRRTLRIPAGAEVCSQRFTIPLATGDLAANTTGVIGFLPAGCVPVDVHVDGTDMDSSTAAMVLAVGIGNGTVTTTTDLSTATADGGGEWGRTTATNTAFYQRIVPTLQALATVQQSTTADRPLAVKVITAPTTAVAGTLGVTLFYRAA